jgi:hypothetical protein
MNCNSVVINRIVFKLHPPGNHKTDYVYNGQYFETPEEQMTAEILTCMGIRFMHHVNFVFYKKPNDRQPVIWCPDFVLEQPFLWQGAPHNGAVLVGMELKRSKLGGRPKILSHALLRAHNINIILLNNEQLLPYYDRKELPLRVVA